MDNQLILKISIVIAVIGIAGLYVFTSTSENMIETREMPDNIGQRPVAAAPGPHLNNDRIKI